MNKKIIIGLLLVFLIALALLLILNNRNDEISEDHGEMIGFDTQGNPVYTQQYSGPVRPSDNESHFRLTGETIPNKN